MAFKVLFDIPGDLSGHTGALEVSDFSVQEDTTPLSAGDSSGSVGTFSITFPVPDPYLSAGSNNPWLLVRDIGPQFLIGAGVRLVDSRKGFTLGTVGTASTSYDGGTITVTGLSRLGQLNVYGVQAPPLFGVSLVEAFYEYVELAGITTDVFSEVDIPGPLFLPGWNGELWFHLKQLAAAYDCEVSLVSGIILLRKVRARIATENRDISRGFQTGGETLAQSVEIYQYNSRQTDPFDAVYPVGGWHAWEGVEVLNVNAGETAEYTLETSVSMSSISPLEILTSLTPGSVYPTSVTTVVGDDGLPVSQEMWDDHGGSIEIEIAPDTVHLNVRLVGPTDLPNASGVPSSNFQLALASDTTGNRYSTLHVRGVGVRFNKVKKTVRTGVPASRTATEVGVTIDNPFISTTNQLYSTGTRAARRFAGAMMSLSGEVIAINRRGDTGQATYPTYLTEQGTLGGTLFPSTYATVQNYYDTQGLATYGQVWDYWREWVRDDDVDQVFGNVAGARIYDRKTRRWYRIRNAALNPATINFGFADDDQIYDDQEGFWSDLNATYQAVQDARLGFTYLQDELVGMYNG